MFRRTLARLISLSEAQRLVLDAQGQPKPTATANLSQLLQALTEHYKEGGEAFAKAALQHVVQLDHSNADTQLVADACLVSSSTPAATISATTTAKRVPPDASSSPPASRHLVTELLRVYPHSPEVRERCCRCMANLCQLAADSDTSMHTKNVTLSPSHASNASAPGTNVADALVEEGAVELILGTLSMASRLSSRGRCWAAMAMLNITCMSHGGAACATKAGAMERLSEFILLLLDGAVTASSSPSGAASGPIRGLSEETAIALDAALGALTGVLAAEAPENAKGLSFNYEATSYIAVDAVVRALLLASELLVRDGRNDGAYGASLPSRRYGTVSFPTSTPTQQTAVVVLLPLLHKAWMALQAVSSTAANLPMVFDVVYEAANANQESMVMANENAVGGSEEVLQVTAQTERRYVAALSSLVEGALFLTAELEGLEAIGADELVRLQKDVRLYVMDTMQAMTAARKDSNKGSGCTGSDGAEYAPAAVEEAAAVEDGAAIVYPTPAAMSILDVLTSGSVSHMALATAVRLHTEHQDMQHARTSGAATTAIVPTPYATADFTLLSKSLVVLANVAEVGDEVATSANSVAALQAILEEAAETVRALPLVYKSDLAALFKPTEDATAEPSADLSHTRVIRDEDRLSFLQQAALAGQVYAVLWSTLRTAQGVKTVSQLSVLRTAQEMQTVLRESYLPAVAVAKERYGGATAKTARAEGDSSSSPSAARKGWVSNSVEETVVRLLNLSDELIGNLSTLSEAARTSPHGAV